MLECVKISLEEGVTTKTRDGLRTQREREERGGSRGRGGGGLMVNLTNPLARENKILYREGSLLLV